MDNSAAKDTRELRRFGLIFGAALAIAASLFLWRGKAAYPYIYAASAVSALLAVIRPRLLKYPKEALAAFIKTLAWAVTNISLIAVFYLVITPIGMVSRLFGRGFMDVKFERNKETYWTEKEGHPPGRETYTRQF